MMFSYIPVHLLSGWNGVFPFSFTLFLDMCIYMIMEFSLNTVQDYGLIIIKQSKYLLRYIHDVNSSSCQHSIA